MLHMELPLLIYPFICVKTLVTYLCGPVDSLSHFEIFITLLRGV